jgi:hypothetical protein
MSRNKLGPIPDDYFENDPIYPPKKIPPLSKEELEWIDQLKHGSDKCRPGDIVGPFARRREWGSFGQPHLPKTLDEQLRV